MPSIYVVELAGATNVTLDQLQITGGYDGVYASNTAGSTGLTISNSTITANNAYGVYLDGGNDDATLTGNTVFGIPGSTAQGQTTGLYLASNNDTVSDNTVYQNGGTGIAVSNRAETTSSAATRSTAVPTASACQRPAARPVPTGSP